MTEIILDFIKKNNFEQPDRISIGAAGPVVNGTCHTTNIKFKIDVTELSRDLQIDKVYLINDLEATAFEITEKLKDINGKGYVSVNKALVTQASSAIPVIPLYISLLYKIMKAEGIHEGCIEQIQRLYQERLFTGNEIPVDEKGRIRVDDWEMRSDVQEKIAKLWGEAVTENLSEIGDLEGYRKDFYNLFGFDVDGVDYEVDTNEMVNIESIT